MYFVRESFGIFKGILAYSQPSCLPNKVKIIIMTLQAKTSLVHTFKIETLEDHNSS